MSSIRDAYGRVNVKKEDHKESPTDLTINLYELKHGMRVPSDKTGKHFKQKAKTKSLWLWYSHVISNRGQIDKIQVKIDEMEKLQSYIEKENYSIWQSFEEYMERNKLKDSANVMFNVVGRLVLTENKAKLEKQIDKLTKEMGKIKEIARVKQLNKTTEKKRND